MKTSGIETIIFDFGGVILDIDPQLTMNGFARLGARKLTPAETQDMIQTLIRRFERGIYTPEVFRKRMMDFLQFKATAQQFDEAWNALLLDIPRERIEVIEQVKKNYKIFLLSNSNEIHYDLYVRDLQLRFGYTQFDDLFEKSYFSFDLHMSKPELDIFEFMIFQHGMDVSKTLFIDDTEENIVAAKKLGLRTYLLKEPERVRDIFNNGFLAENIEIG